MKKSPEPIILAVVLVLLIVVAAGLAMTFPSVSDITGLSDMTPQGHRPPQLVEADLESKLAAWTSPAGWAAPAENHRLFISDGILFYPSLYPQGNYLQRDDGTARTAGGVLIRWYQKYGLDFTDPNIDREDPDNDGFSNLTEFKNEEATAAQADGSHATNPLDPQSHPSYLSRLRLQKFDSQPFRIQFRGYQQLNGINYFEIYLADEPSYNQPALKKTGDSLGFQGYVIGAFHEDIESKADAATHIVTQVNLSTLELDRPDIDFHITLTYRQEIDSPESTANFVMLMPSEVNNVIKIPRGKTFTPPYMTGTTFLVIDANANGAVIRNVQDKQNINVPLLDPNEWNEVPIPPVKKTP